MGRKTKQHDAETGEGPHQDEKPSQRKDDQTVDGKSNGLWTRETKISLVIMTLLLSGLGTAVYFRLSPESVGKDPFAMLRNDSSEESDSTEQPPTEDGALTPPAAAVVVSESTSFTAVNEPSSGAYGDPPSYQQPDPWPSTPSTGAPPAGPSPQGDGSFAQQAGSLADQATGQVIDQAQVVADGFNQQAGSLSQQVRQTTDSTLGQFQQAAGEVRDQVDALSQQVSEALPSDVQQDLGTLAADARQAVDGLTDQAGQAVDAFTQQNPQALDAVVGQVGEVLGDQMPRAEEFTRQAADSIRDTAQSTDTGSTPFPTAGTTPEQAPLSAFEPPATVTVPVNPQAPGNVQWSDTSSTAAPLVTIAEPPSQLNSTAPQPNQSVAPAAPIGSSTPPPAYSPPQMQPRTTVPSSRRESDTFGQAPQRFDTSAFDPPAATPPSDLPRTQSPAPPVQTTAPAQTATPVPATLPPAAQPPATPTDSRNFNRSESTYSVQPNDNYWLISEKLYGTGAYFKALFEHNRDRFPRANRLRVGDVIRTPPSEVLQQTYPKLCPRATGVSSSAGTSTGGLPMSRGPLGDGRTYVVQEGDTLFDIARYELGEANRWHEIRQLNRDVLGDNADRLRAGIQLRLPAVATTGIATRPQPTINR